MILSHKHKLIFIHIGKTGGTSIESALCKLLNINWDDTKYNEDVVNNIHKLEYAPFWVKSKDYAGRINCKHISAKDLKQIVGDKVWGEYFKFAFVRNPFDRLLSEYSMFTQFEEYKDHKWNEYGNFEGFLESIVSCEEFIGRDPYSDYLMDSSGNLLVDFIGKFENLQADFDKVCDKIGCEKMRLPNKRPTDHRSYKTYYTPETVYMLSCIYRNDIRSFSYRKHIRGIEHPPPIKSFQIMLRFYYSYKFRYLPKGVKTRVLRIINSVVNLK